MQRILKEYALQFPQNIKQLLFHIDNNDISQFYSLCIFDQTNAALMRPLSKHLTNPKLLKSAVY